MFQYDVDQVIKLLLVHVIQDRVGLSVTDPGKWEPGLCRVQNVVARQGKHEN
jgi:hypothetical protein